MRERILNDDFLPSKELKLNRFQFLLTSCFPRIHSATSIGGRGVGKSSQIALLIREIVRTMPRSMWIIQGATFQQLLTRTLPGTFAFLDYIGMKKDVDFFINKYPPKKYDMPFHNPLSPENCIFFINHEYKAAVGFSLFSQDRSSSRGPSRDGVICDESLLLDWDMFSAETMATIRGNDAYFKHVPMHHGVFHFTSMPSGDSKLFEHGDYYKGLLDVRGINDQRIELQLEFMQAKSIKERLELWQEIDRLSFQLKYFISKKKLLYTEFNTFDNIEHLGIRYIQQQFDSMPMLLFLIEILNKRITQVVDSFYPLLDRKVHGYTGRFDYDHLEGIDYTSSEALSLDCRQDKDCMNTLSLHVGIDFGTAINWFITAQYIRGMNRLNFIKNHYVKSPSIIDDLAKEWCEYYKHHQHKVVFLYPGADGHNKQPNIKGQVSYVQQISNILRKNGWNVVVKKVQKYEYSHHEKYLCWARSLAQQDKRYPSIGINLINCSELFLVLENTPAKDYGGKIEKDKSSEKKMILNREEATDAGDAADQVLYTMFGYLNRGATAGVEKSAQSL